MPRLKGTGSFFRMNSEYKTHSKIELPAFPKCRWILLAILLWVFFGCTPLLLIIIGTNLFSLADSRVAEIAGTIGDSFGLANSFFAGGALLFVIWSIRLQQQEIRFAREEWEENTESQREQARMMKDAADLTAINHIYQHYSEKYGQDDPSRIKEGIAAGHRTWAIRESFDKIDKSFSAQRIEQVEKLVEGLIALLMNYNKIRDGLLGKQQGISPDAFPEIAFHTASLLVDARVPAQKRMKLWPLYEILRETSTQTLWGKTQRNERFNKIVEDVLAGLQETIPNGNKL
jgi:hypothetical protein